MTTSWTHTLQHVRSKVFGRHPPFDPKCEWCRRLMPNEHLLLGPDKDRPLSLRLADSAVVTRHLFRIGNVPGDHDVHLRKVCLAPTVSSERLLDLLLSLSTFQVGCHVICLIDIPTDAATGTWVEDSHTYTGDSFMRSVQLHLKPGTTIWVVSRHNVPFQQYVYEWSGKQARLNNNHSWSKDPDQPRFVWWQNVPPWSEWLPWFIENRGRVTLHDLLARYPQTKLYSNWPLGVQKTFLGF